MQRLKQLITCDTVVCQRKGLEPKSVPAPHIILCSHDAEELGHDLGDRRFCIVRLDP